MSVRLHLGGAVDVPAMLEVMQAAFDTRFGEAWSGPQLLGALTMPNTWVQLASDSDSGAMLGFAMTRRVLTQAELLLVAVVPARRGTGLGREVLQSAMDAAVANGADEIFLEVRDGNAPAFALYKSTDFAIVGRRRDYYAGTAGERFDAITMRRSLQR